MGYLSVLIAIAFFFYAWKITELKNAESVTVTSQPKKVKDTLKEEAITTLKELGYTATESKKLVSNITANSVDEYVKKAMEQIEI